MFIRTFCLVFIFCIGLTTCNIILKPNKTDGFESGYIFVHGASIPAKNYLKYALDLQKKFNGSLWIGLAEFPMDTPEPVLINTIMNSLFNEFKKEGFNYNKDTLFYFAGHSLGGIVLQDYLFENYNKLPFKFDALILEGSFITRKNQNKNSNPKFPPVLTLGAELDGLARITRMAESYYFDNLPNVKERRYTIVIPGMNHYEFCGEGKAPPNVVKNDIVPEINETVARNALTSLITAYIHIVQGRPTGSDMWWLTDYILVTMRLVEPIIDAFNLEGFYHFKPPCYFNSNFNNDNCTLGSTFTSVAQSIVGLGDITHLISSDLFENRERFPTLNNNCSSGTPCILNISTTTDNIYSPFDSFDTGLQPVAAIEARTKLVSRQAILEAFYLKPFSVNETDDISLCGAINQESIKYALNKSALATLKRYLKIGKQLKVVDDEKESSGAQWISNPLKFTQKNSVQANRTYYELASPTLIVATEYPVKIVSGVHYCKVLTPARAMEWIYVDSLKP